MSKIQVLVLNVLSIALLGLALTLVAQNVAVTVDAQWLAFRLAGVPMSMLLAASALLAGAGVSLKMWALLGVLGKQQQRAAREIERREVSREEAEARVKTLENKVQSLEKALQQALKA